MSETAMNRDRIIPDVIKERIARSLHISRAKLVDTALVSDVVTESFAIVEMVIDLQEEFGIRLGQEDLKTLKTIGDFKAQIVERAKKAA
jgi:acyl carrier protein